MSDARVASHSVAAVDPDSKFSRSRSYPGLVIHNLVPGQRTVVGYRWYSPGSLIAIDDEGFEKITIELPNEKLATSGPVTLELSTQSHLAYTRGGAAWPSAACFGIAKSGKIELTRTTNGSVLVHISATVDPIQETGDRCTTVELERKFECKVIEFRELTPWLGLAAEHPYEETYR